MKSKKNFWTFFIDNYRLTYILLVGIIIFGIYSVLSIPKESSPEIDIPIIVISTVLPGASPSDVEELVTNEIESKVQGLTDIDSLSSSSKSGFSMVTISFSPESDGREKLSDVREKMSGIQSELPSDASDPVVQQISFSDQPILTLALTGPHNPEVLKEYAESLKKEVERINDVSKVNITGAPEQEIQVTLNQERLSQFNLSAREVVNALSQANTDIPIGSIETAGNIYTVKFEGRLTDVKSVANTAVTNLSGSTVFVRDIGEVKDTFSRLSTLTRFSDNGGESVDSVTLQIFKSSGQGDILVLADAVQVVLDNAEREYLPEDVDIEIIRSDADLIRSDLSSLMTSGVLTILIVLSVLVLFLGWKEALLASVVVPLTLLITFLVLKPLGYTINFLTLFSLILALGILVDASIVITEGMFSKISQGRKPYDAAIETVNEFQAPLISGTLTTIFVFVPMAFMGGIIGKFIESIPVTVTIVLTGAIFVSLAIITTLGVQLLRVKSGESAHGVAFVRTWIDKLYEWYHVQLNKLIRSGKNRRKLFLVISLSFVLSLSLPILGVVKLNMFPPADGDSFNIDISNPSGTPLSVTNAQLRDVEYLLSEEEQIESLLVTAGSGSSAGSLGTGVGDSSKGFIIVNLKKDRKETSLKIIDNLEKRFLDLGDIDVTISQEAGGPPQGNPVQVNIKGDSLEDLDIAAVEIASMLKGISGTRNIDNGIGESGGEFRISVDRAKARSYGVSPAQIAGSLRSAISGESATTIKSDGTDTEVIVLFDVGANYGEVGAVPRLDIEGLKSITIPTPRGNMPLSVFSNISLGSSRTSIVHDDGDRVTIVTADIADGANAANITKEIQSRIINTSFPEGLDITYGGETEDIAESFTSLGVAMIVGIMLIFALLVWQFGSYLQPLFVLSTIPLALVGVLPGLAITMQPISFPGFIGIVALAGIVVNNAIILIDSINNSRKEGLSIIDSVEESAKSRLQPILLTTITTVAGMVPLIFSNPTWSPIAYSIIFGLMFSTILTLFVIPALYVSFVKEDEKVISEAETKFLKERVANL